MALCFTDEEVMLAEAADGFLIANSGASEFRQLKQRGETQSHVLWSQMTQMGWPSLHIEKKFGGLEMGVLAGCTLAEAIGRHLSLVPFISSAMLTTEAISKFATESQKATWLPQLGQGKQVCALAIDDIGVRNPVDCTATLKRKNKGFTLNGAKDFVVDGMAAEHILVLTRFEGKAADASGLALCRVSTSNKAVHSEQQYSIDGRDFARFTIDHAEISEEDLLGEGEIPQDKVEWLIGYGAVLYAAEQLGSAQAAYDLTLEYLKQRKQFGKLIGSFQALQHRMSIAYTELSLAEALIIKACLAIDEGRDDAMLLCSLAKAKAGQVARHVTNEAVQMHGGIGMTDEYDVGLYMKRVAVSERLYGGCDFHVNRIACLNDY